MNFTDDDKIQKAVSRVQSMKNGPGDNATEVASLQTLHYATGLEGFEPSTFSLEGLRKSKTLTALSKLSYRPKLRVRATRSLINQSHPLLIFILQGEIDLRQFGKDGAGLKAYYLF